MYEIKNIDNIEKKRIDNFIKTIEDKSQSKIIFIDVVSVERKENQHYLVKWLAKSKNSLEKYYNLISNYFKDSNSRSLLFLAPNADENTKVVCFNDISPNCHCNDPSLISTSIFLEVEFQSFSVDSISTCNESTQINNWKINILAKMCISSAVFTKIDFNIGDKAFTAGIWIGFNNSICNTIFENDSDLKPHIQKFLWSYSTQTIALDLIQTINIQASRAAISQVMARNSSHNIGSHVMNKLTGDLSSLALLDFSKINELNYQSTYEKDLQKLHSEIEKEINADKGLKSLTKEQREKVLKHKILLAQIALFNNYIKCRMDYLADITLGIPAMQISKRLKSDVLKSLDEVRLLLENISGLSGFKYSIDLKCDFDKDPAIAMPNDILGCQAFYNIVENVIRNTAKHSDKKNIDDADKIVRVTIEIKHITTTNFTEQLLNQSDLLYEANIYDNIIVEGDAKLDEDDKEEYYRETNISKDTNISKIDYLVYSQNKKLNDSILKKEDHTLRSTNLGLIELEASACYLRKMDIANLESDDYQIDFNDKIENSKGNLNILKAVAIKNKYLGYRFFVLKPTEVLLVGNYELSAELKNNGFLCLSFVEFKKEIEKEAIFNHQFLVYDSEIQIDIEDSDFSKIKCSKGQDSFTFFKSLTPKRYFQLAGNSLEFKEKNAEDILNCLWEKWGELNIKWSKKKITNSLCGDTPENDLIFLNHTKEQIEKNGDESKKFNELFLENDTYKYYIEPLSSKAQSKLPNPITELKRGSIKDRNSVKESAFQQIVIIDERVQYAAYHNKDEGILFHKYYQKSNVLVPNMDIDLAANDLASIKDKLNAYLEKEIDENSIGKERFLLIHYSILERLFKESTNKISDVNNWLNDYAKKTNVVVISGRGIPPELSESVSYVSLSSVLASLIDFRSKYYFSNIIMSSRKSKKNE